jgi:hypothetical protein
MSIIKRRSVEFAVVAADTASVAREMGVACITEWPMCGRPPNLRIAL